MERDTELLSTLQPNQCQNASQKFYAGSALFRGMAGWGHVPITMSPSRAKVEITKELVRIPHNGLLNQALRRTGRS